MVLVATLAELGIYWTRRGVGGPGPRPVDSELGQRRDEHHDQERDQGTAPASLVLALEGQGERVPVREASSGIAREAPLDDPDEPRGNVPSLAPERRRLRPLREERDELHRVVALERGLSREALVEDRSEGEHVGRRSRGSSVPELLGGRVAGRPPEHAVARQGDAPARPGCVPIEVLREPEVDDQGASVGREEHVLRLEVAVDDPSLVGASERTGELPSELGRLLDPEGPAVEPVPERASGDERHDEVRSHARRSRIEERHEPVLHRERREEPPLALEASELLGLGPEEELERHDLPRGGADTEDDAHAAAAELAQDLVRTDLHERTMALEAADGNPGRREQYPLGGAAGASSAPGVRITSS